MELLVLIALAWVALQFFPEIIDWLLRRFIGNYSSPNLLYDDERPDDERLSNDELKHHQSSSQ